MAGKKWFIARLKRRRVKVPLTLISILFLLIVGGGYGYFHLKRLEGVEGMKESIAFHTWDQFHEMERLNMLLQGFAIRSIADIPSTHLEALNLSELKISHYLGVVKDRGEAGALQARFGSAESTFMGFDVTIDVLPRVDLILCWDYLCTLSPLEIRAALLQFKKSGATFLLMRHFPQMRENEGKQSGVLQPINWKLPPYNFPEPIIHIMESGEGGMESLALWNLENLP